MKNEEKSMQYLRLEKAWQRMIPILSPLILLIAWEVLSRTALIDPRFFPPPTTIFTAFVAMAKSGELITHLSISLLRITMGFLAGAVPAILIGLWMGMYKRLRAFLSPIIMAIMPIPTLALMPIIVILFGIGEVSKIVTIAGSVFFPVVINTALGVVNIERVYIDVAKNYGADARDFFFHIALPGALPVMMEGIQMGQAIALLTIVAAEMIGAQSGIGYLIWTSYKLFVFPAMYIGLVLISFFGYFFSLLLRWLEKRLIPWH